MRIPFLILMTLFLQAVNAQNLLETRTASLQDGDYLLQGTVYLESFDDGTLDLRFDSDYLTQSNVFDVHVFLTNDNNYAAPIDTAGMLLVENIGSIDGINYSSGAMTFDLPVGVGINDYQYIIFICMQFGRLHWGDGVFSDPVSNADPTMKARLMLEACIQGGSMTTELNNKGLIPINQPFDEAPWFYSGSESAPNIPTDAVDWVLVELRDPADPALLRGRTAGFLLADGSIVDTDGNLGVPVSNSNSADNHYLVLRTRSHAAVMSSVPIASTITYDFTTSATSAYGSNQLKNVGGTFCAYAGDFYGDGAITFADFNNYISNPSAIDQYLNWDANKDGLVSVLDFNFYKSNASFMVIPELRY